MRNPLPSGTNYCLISLGVGVGQWVGALFMCKGSGSVCQKWSLASPTDQKNGGNAEGLSEKVL